MNLSVWSFLILIFAPVFFCMNILYCRIGTVAGLVALSEKRFSKLELPQILFLAWLGWAALGCLLSENRTIAIEGYYLRLEGLVTWITLTAVALLTPKRECEMNKLLIWLCIISMALFFGRGYFYEDIRFKAYIIENVSMAAFAACAFVFAWTYAFPSVSSLVFGAVIMSATRSGLLAVFTGVLSYYLMSGLSKTIYKRLAYLLIALIVFSYLTPLKQKLENLNMTFTGSRSQWILHSDKLIHALPLTGFGLDTLSKHLVTAKGETKQRMAIADRVHFMPLDICLQTGWIGLTLFMLCFGSVIAYAMNYPSQINLASASVMVTWFIFGCINPTGIQATLLMLICLFQVRKPNDKI